MGDSLLETMVCQGQKEIPADSERKQIGDYDVVVSFLNRGIFSIKVLHEGKEEKELETKSDIHRKIFQVLWDAHGGVVSYDEIRDEIQSAFGRSIENITIRNYIGGLRKNLSDCLGEGGDFEFITTIPRGGHKMNVNFSEEERRLSEQPGLNILEDRYLVYFDGDPIDLSSTQIKLLIYIQNNKDKFLLWGGPSKDPLLCRDPYG